MTVTADQYKAMRKRVNGLEKIALSGDKKAFLQEIDDLLLLTSSEMDSKTDEGEPVWLCAGIDPGASGALTVVVVTHDSITPTLLVGFKGIEHKHLFTLVGRILKFVKNKGGIVALEKVHARPNDTPKTAWSFAENFTWIQSAIFVCGCPGSLVSPQKWQADLALLGSGLMGKKKKLMDRCQEMYPLLTMSEGGKGAYADATLIAHWAAAKKRKMFLPSTELGF